MWFDPQHLTLFYFWHCVHFKCCWLPFLISVQLYALNPNTTYIVSYYTVFSFWYIYIWCKVFTIVLLKHGLLHSLIPPFVCALSGMQHSPVCRLRNQFLPFGNETFCHLSSKLVFPKRIHNLPHSSFLQEKAEESQNMHTDLII